MNTGNYSQRAQKSSTRRNPVTRAFQGVRDRFRQPSSQCPDLSDGYNDWRDRYNQREADRLPGPNGENPYVLDMEFRFHNYDTQLFEDIIWHRNNYDNAGHPVLFPAHEDQNLLRGWNPPKYIRETNLQNLSVLMDWRRYSQDIINENENMLIGHAKLIANFIWPAEDLSWATTVNQHSPWSWSKMFRYRSSPSPIASAVGVTVVSYEKLFPQWLPDGTPPAKPNQRKPKRLRFKMKFKSSSKSSKKDGYSTPPPRWTYIGKEDANLWKLAHDELAKGKSSFQVAAEKGAIQQKLFSIRNYFQDGQRYVDECEDYLGRIIEASNTATENLTRNKNNPNDELKRYFQRQADRFRRHADGALLVMKHLRASHEEAHENLQDLEATYQQYKMSENYDVEVFTKQMSRLSTFLPSLKQYTQQLHQRFNATMACIDNKTYLDIITRGNRDRSAI